MNKAIDLETKIQFFPGIGSKLSEAFLRLGIETAQDLIFYFPRRYEDYSQITKISDLGISKSGFQIPNESRGESVTIAGSVIGIANKRTRRRGFTVTEAVVADETGTLKVIWFNQPYLQKMLKAGSRVILHGRANFNQYSSELTMESPTRASRPMIVPIYGETTGVSSYLIGKLFDKCKHLVEEVQEWLPLEFLISNSEFLNKSQIPNSKSNYKSEQSNQTKLLSICQAIMGIHQPKNSEELAAAQKRLAFDELFMISLRANVARVESQKQRAESLKADLDQFKSIVADLPFELTGDQKKALWVILQDMEKETPMRRLLNGDVGSGKTIVAALAALVAVQNGKRALFMCPTEILATQHFETLSKLFGDKLTVGLWTSSQKIISKSKSNRCLSEDDKGDLNSDIIIGTQALIQKGIFVENVGLVIVDEQHRFGVRQRQALQEISNIKCQISNQISKTKLSKGSKKLSNDQINDNCQLKTVKFAPHFLSMTATPIPRTLHLALFGDLDVSVIREKPKNRKEIKTRFVQPFNRDKAYDFIRAQLSAGRQAFVICPLIEDMNHESRTMNQDNSSLFEEERKSVKAEFEKLKKVYPEFSIEMLHGKLKAKEKNEIMARFASGEAKILVSTSVVEVGVDVPNASVMMIEDAERFGLAQIHQFRGRVGRGEHQSFCFLFSNSQSEKAINRLRGVEAITDGFQLAELDLELRGPGAVFGTEQSGMLDLKMASISDRVLIEQASAAAKELAPNIENYPKLVAKLSEFAGNKHLE